MPTLYETYTPPSSGGKYLKIQDGESVKLRFVGYPVIFTKMFPGAEMPTTRYAWVVFNHDDGEAYAFEQGVTFYRKIANLAKDEEWGDPSEYDIKVSRTGSGTDTEYNMNPSPKKSTLTTEQLEKTSAINLTSIYRGSISLEDAAKGKKPVEDLGDVIDEISDEPIDLSNINF